jgi:Inner membrane component of T3SS, cytoplasmic domain
MSTETGDKIKIEWDDLKTRKVDQRLREQEAVARNRKQAELNPVTTEMEAPTKGSIWYNALFTMSVFGLLGGLLAWGGGEILRFREDPKSIAQIHMHEIGDLTHRAEVGQMSPADADSTIETLRTAYSSNPYFTILSDPALSNDQRDTKIKDLDNREELKNFIANLLSFGLCGMLIAACLSIAEPVVDRNARGSLINGMAGAALGIVGGVVVSLFVEQLFNALGGEGRGVSYQQVMARSVTWGVLGLFLMVGPGIVMRNAKKLLIGMIGGLLGGLVGGALFDPLASATGNNAHISRLVALVAIGVVAGLGTGLIEHAAKSGWLKVTAGLIAGKQFILYRNPTFIGSGPECQIYLFRDAKVGRRHAAVHIVAGGFELQNLPLGAETKINGKLVERARLRNGDMIQIGNTSFKFQEKTKGNAE